MPFKNRIRLPFYLTRPQFPNERNITRLTDGSTRVRSVVIRKTYEGETEYLPEWIHQRLIIALGHDHINIEGDRYLGGVSLDGDYDIDWQRFLDFPYAKADFKIQATPFNATNANCKSCDEAQQLDLVDDLLPDPLTQSHTYTFNVFENDTIGCVPFTSSVTWFNALAVQSASINNEGVMTIVTKPLIFVRNNVLLATYRVTCANGSYDEASVYGGLTGDLEACLEPTNLHVTGIDTSSAQIGWNAPSPVPVGGYDWKLATLASPAVLLDSGNTIGTNITLPVASDPLEPATDYIFSVRAKCDTDDFSEWVDLPFHTAAQGQICGRYRVTFFDEAAYKDVTYIACNGMLSTIRLLPFQPRIICVLQNSPNHPVQIIGANQITYVGPCA